MHTAPAGHGPPAERPQASTVTVADVRILLIALGSHAAPALDVLDGTWRDACDTLAIPAAPEQLLLPPGAGPLGFLLLDARDEHLLADVPRVLAALEQADFERVGVGFHHPSRPFSELRPSLLRMARRWDTFMVAPVTPPGSAGLAATARTVLESLVVGGYCGYDYADFRTVTAPPRVGSLHVWPAIQALPAAAEEALRAPCVRSALVTVRAAPEVGLAEMQAWLDPVLAALGPEVAAMIQLHTHPAPSELAVVVLEGE